MKCAYLSTCSKPDPKPKKQKAQHENMIPELQGPLKLSQKPAGGKLSCPNVQIFLSRWLPFLASVLYTAVHPEPRMLKLHSFVNFSITAHCWWCWVLGSKSRSSTSREKKFYHQFSIVKYSYLPTDTFRKYVEMQVTRSKLTLKFPGYCRHYRVFLNTL